MALSAVPVPPYPGFSLAEMQAELARYKSTLQALTPGASNIVSASANGSSFTYGPNGTWSLEQWGAEIMAAMAWVDDSVIDQPGETVAAFNR